MMPSRRRPPPPQAVPRKSYLILFNNIKISEIGEHIQKTCSIYILKEPQSHVEKTPIRNLKQNFILTIWIKYLMFIRTDICDFYIF